MRVAVGSIFQESNCFVQARTGLDSFRNTYVYQGDELLALRGRGAELGGILGVLDSEGIEVVPLFAASSVSGGVVEGECFRYLRSSLLDALAAAGRVDGVALVMHGSMAAEDEDDPEGSVLAGVRELVGRDVPVVSTLDLHANVTPLMVENATALVGYKEYPHTDTFETGQQAARLLVEALRGEIRPVMALAKVSLIVPAANAQTLGGGPMAEAVGRAREAEREAGVLAATAFLVHPWNDLPGMGCAGLVVADGDAVLAARCAETIAVEFWGRRREFLPELLSVADALERGRAIDGGPVVLADGADTVGAGAAGDTVGLLRELIELGVREPSFAMVVDPPAAQECMRAGIGAAVSVELGHRLDPTWGEPLRVTGVVRSLHDGRFVYTGGIYGGAEVSMGPSAVIDFGNVRVLIMSRATYDWSDEQYRAAGMDVRAAKFVAVKNGTNYRMAYRDVAKASFLVDVPGPSASALSRLPYRRAERPVFALDEDVPEQRAVVITNARVAAA